MEKGKQGLSWVREVKKYKRLVSVSVIRPAVSVASKLSTLPQRLGDRGSVLSDDYISKEWFSGP